MRKIKVRHLRVGDVLDLQNDPYADPAGTNTFYPCEYAVIAAVTQETLDCFVLDFEHGATVGFPADHQVCHHPREEWSPDEDWDAVEAAALADRLADVMRRKPLLRGAA